MPTLTLNRNSVGRAVPCAPRPARSARPTNNGKCGSHINTVLNRCQLQIKNQQRAYIVSVGDDERIVVLARWLMQIGDDARLVTYAREEEHKKQNLVNLQFCLSNLVAFCLLWLSEGDPNYRRAIGLIAAERARQCQLFREGRIAFDCASPVPDPRRKFRVLFEECGEVAHAIDQVENHGMAASNICMEVKHVAAVAVAWLESLETDGGKIMGAESSPRPPGHDFANMILPKGEDAFTDLVEAANPQKRNGAKR